jgi:hypothetical protein
MFIGDSWDETFIEPGMVAWLTKVQTDMESNCYILHFDFSEFESHNNKYFTKSYYPKHSSSESDLITAIESGDYTPKFKMYFGDVSISDYNIQQLAKDSMVVLAADYP